MIRHLQKSDIPSLLDFFYTDRNVQQDSRFDFEAQDIEIMLEHSHIYQLVWEDAGQLVGYLGGYNMGVWGYIDVLIVKPTHRIKGIGTALMDYFSGLHPEWVRLETSCYATDKQSVQFVKKYGFDIEQQLVWFGKEV